MKHGDPDEEKRGDPDEEKHGDPDEEKRSNAKRQQTERLILVRLWDI